ncbi:MAG: hypothetical protein GY934_11740 [Gammaproteobacteria bacterium]|nr:hypothetical protein [Gammaproteobacteria bacterium]
MEPPDFSQHKAFEDDAIKKSQFRPETKQQPRQKTELNDISGGIPLATADTPATEDHLGRTPLVETLADMLAHEDQPLPMTVALLGDWGSGKSSVIEQLKKRLDIIGPLPHNKQFLVAEFDAWEYEQTDNIQAGLAQEVVRGLTRKLNRLDRFRLAVKNASTQHGWSFYLTLTGLLATSGLSLLGVLNLQTIKDGMTGLAPITQSVLGTGGITVLLFTLVRTWQQTRRFLEHPLAVKLSTYLQLPSYGKHLGLIPVIKNEIKSLCKSRLGDSERLLVVVDNLDRCRPACITETLDAIRLVMNLSQVAVILAIDDRIAFQAVAEHYRALADDGGRSKEEIARDYLGKIIQLPINLYQPWPWEVNSFIREYLFPVNTGENKATTSSPSNHFPGEEVSFDPQLMKDTAFEQEHFIAVTTQLGFHNPRQLIRLRNSYRLLKGYRHNRKEGQLRPQLLEELMWGLFWHEYLYQQNRERRQQAELVIWHWEQHTEWQQRAAYNEAEKIDNPPAVNMARWLTQWHTIAERDQNYIELMKTVEMVVLPNTHMGLILKRDKAEQLLKEITIDPWQ